MRSPRNLVVSSFLRRGVPPSWAELMREFGQSRAATTETLRALADAHDLVLLPNQQRTGNSDHILMSHPFSALPTAHFAELPRTAVDAALSAHAHGEGAPAEGEGATVRRYGN